MTEVTSVRRLIINMMNTLLSPRIPSGKKIKDLNEKYGFKMDCNVGKEIGHMCNLSEIVEKNAHQEGLQEGERKRAFKIAENMIRTSELTDQEISEMTELPIDNISELRKKNDKLI